ncbi:unnamed protein product [Knipowitschia caucasica]
MKTVLALALLLVLALLAEGSPRPDRKLTIYDLVRGGDSGKEAAPAMIPTKRPTPSKGSDGFNLEDALSPADPGKSGAADQTDIIQALAEIRKRLDVLMEVENTQMRLLQQRNRC